MQEQFIKEYYMDNERNDMTPELKDIVEMVKRYNISNRQGCFLFSFVGFDKDMENTCDECGDHSDKISDSKTLSGACGDLQTLREMLNFMRDAVEDNINEEGFVSF